MRLSMVEENDLGCSYAVVTKALSHSSVLVIFRGKDGAIIDYDGLKEGTYRCLLMKHYCDEHVAYRDFLKLVGKMCKKHDDSKYFLNHRNEDNWMVCLEETEHMILNDEKKVFEERRKAFEQFISTNKMYF